MESSDVLLPQRLSFGANKSGFPIGNYLGSLEEMDASKLNFTNLMQGIDPNLEQELLDLKEYSSKLKFNYLELFTKQLFLSKLQDRKDWNLGAFNENEQSERKLAFKEMKEKNALLINETTNIIKELVESYQKFQQEKEALVACQEDAANATKKQKFAHHQVSASRQPATPQKTSVLDNWCAQLTQTISRLSGLYIENIGEDKITIRVNLQPTYHVEIGFKPSTAVIATVKLSPADIPIQDIVDYAKQFNDFQFLMREIRSRITNFGKRQKEMERVARIKGCVINCQLGTASATITFNSGLMVTLETDLDYPQPYTAITVVNVESAVESPQKLGAVKNELNRTPISSITELVAKIEEYLP